MTTKRAKPAATKAMPKPAAADAPAPKRTRAKAVPKPTAGDVPASAEVLEPVTVPAPAPASASPSSAREVDSETGPASPHPWEGTLHRIVVFGLEGQRYALPIEAVQEIQQIVAVSELPAESGAVVGVINVRGSVVPAIDLRVLLDLREVEHQLETPMIFTRTAQGLVALIVDDVEDVIEVPDGSMQRPSSVYALADRLLGVCRLDSGLVFVFDVDALVPPDAAAAGRAGS